MFDISMVRKINKSDFIPRPEAFKDSETVNSADYMDFLGITASFYSILFNFYCITFLY